MRVCLLVPHFAEYGYELACALGQHAEVLVVPSVENVRAELGEQYLQAPAWPGVHVHFIHKTHNPASILQQAAGLARAVRAFGPDVLHAQEDSKDVLAAALPFMGSTPLVLTVHDPKPHSGWDARRRYLTRHGIYISQIRRRADGLIVHGRSLLADARVMLGGDNRSVHVIPHGPLGCGYVSEARRKPTAGRCLFFGRIEAYKGLDVFINTVEQLHASGLPISGVVAGRGSDLARYRKRLVATSGLELIDKFLSREEVVDQFAQAQVVLMPYRNATQSGVSAYAMGLGRPVVAFNVGALGESILHQHTGLLVPAGDTEGFVAATRKLIQQPDLADQLGQNALELGQGRFSWDSIARASISAYSAVIKHCAQRH